MSPEYKAPIEGEASHCRKFIRVKRSLFVTDPGDTSTLHLQLTQVEGVLSEIDKLSVESPTGVDAGYLLVDGNKIIVQGSTMSLNLPLDPITMERAREETVAVFQEKSPGCVVTSIK